MMPPAQQRPRPILMLSVLAASCAIVAGIATLVGWVANIPRLTQWITDGIAMMPNAAAAIVLLGTALICTNLEYRRCAKVTAFFAGMIGGLTVFEHLTGLDLGIDTLLVVREWGQRGTVSPGRMGPPASTCFLTLGISIILIQRSGTRMIGALGGLVVSAIAFLSLSGYLYGADPLFTLPHVTAISLSTSICLTALGLGLILAAPDVDPVKTIMEQSAAGALVRRALPFIVLLPIVIAWLRVQGEHHMLYDSKFGTALRTVVEVGLLTGLLWWAAAAVRQYESALRISEAESRRQARQLAGFLETAAICLHRVGPDGTILWANDAELKTLGYSAEEYIGKNITQFHADERTIADILSRLHKGERLANYKARMKCRDGSIRIVLIDSCVFWDEGRFVHTQCFTRDITERERLDEALREASRRKDEFLATLAHELRNPLAPIRNAVHILQQPGAQFAVTQRACGMIDRQVRHMVRLVDDLLDVSRITTGKFQLRKERVLLSEIIDQALEIARPHVDEGGHLLKVNLPSEPVYLFADSVRLAQVFGNLLNNACKYTEKGGKITLSAQRSDDLILVSVQDTGIGIAKENLSQLFELFSQVVPTLHRSQGGLGIGLALSKGLVELHGGTIKALSDGLGVGSQFLVQLPIMKGSPEDKPAVLSRPTNVPQGRRILVVDDNIDSAESLSMLLQLSGNEVYVAHDGIEGFEAAEKYRPDLVLLDVGMPKMNGYEVCRRIRECSWGHSLKLIAVTGWGAQEDKDRAKAAGFDDHLVKPVDPDSLSEIINRCFKVASYER